MNRLKGKVALITGGTMGIGAACAQRMAEEGADVVIADICRPERALGPGVDFIHADVGNEADVAGAIQHAHARFGRLDILVNNAGANPYYGFSLGVDEARYDKTFEVNVKGDLRGQYVAGYTSYALFADLLFTASSELSDGTLVH